MGTQKPTEDSEEDGTPGDSDKPSSANENTPADCEAEYLDEDLYTTVTVEAVDVSRDGLQKTYDDDNEPGDEEASVKRSSKDDSTHDDGISKPQRKERKSIPSGTKKKKKKFRYESKAERKFTRSKEKLKNSAQARSRKSE